MLHLVVSFNLIADLFHESVPCDCSRRISYALNTTVAMYYLILVS